MAYTLKWTPQQVKKAVIAEVSANAEDVGVFCEVEARRKLLAVTEPEWGAGYRRQIVASLLTHEVEVKSNEVNINIGVARSSAYKSKDYSHYGFYIEMGSRRFPSHPFIRPAIFENAAKIVALLEGQ